MTYNPGAGGAFVSRVISELLTNQLHDVALTTRGSAHTNEGKHILYFLGDLPLKDNESTLSEHLLKCKDLITSNKFHVPYNRGMIIQTHNTYNTMVLRALFPNAKFLCISTRSHRERKIALINHTIKWFGEQQSGRRDFPAHVIQQLTETLLQTREALIQLTNNNDLADRIIQNRFDDDFREIILYIGIQHLFCDNHLLTTPNNSYDFAVNLPYSIIIDSNEYAFIRILSKICDISFNDDQYKFISANFKKYIDCQDRALFENPAEFFNQLQTRVTTQLKLLNP